MSNGIKQPNNEAIIGLGIFFLYIITGSQRSGQSTAGGDPVLFGEISAWWMFGDWTVVYHLKVNPHIHYATLLHLSRVSKWHWRHLNKIKKITWANQGRTRSNILQIKQNTDDILHYFLIAPSTIKMPVAYTHTHCSVGLNYLLAKCWMRVTGRSWASCQPDSLACLKKPLGPLDFKGWGDTFVTRTFGEPTWHDQGEKCDGICEPLRLYDKWQCSKDKQE